MNDPPAGSDDALFAPRKVLGWTLFSLAAGTVNGGALMACRSFVTHVTGTITNLGIDASNPGLAAEYALVFGGFFTGAMGAVLIIETLPARRRELHAIPLLIVFGILLVVAIGGQAGHFGPFGAMNVETPGAFALLTLLAGAMGLQNAAIAQTTRNAIRTTHLTGPTTDLAASLVRSVLGRGLGTAGEARWVLLRLVKILAFVCGAALAASRATQLKYGIFIVAAVFVILGIGFIFVTELGGERSDEGGEQGGAAPSAEDVAPERDDPGGKSRDEAA